jgi:hypothetical protein
VEPKCKIFSWLILQNKLWTQIAPLSMEAVQPDLPTMPHSFGVGLTPHDREVSLLQECLVQITGLV